MVFSSVIFLFGFLPFVLALYFLAPRRFKNGVLLASSLFFYAWGETFYLGLMVISIAMNHAFGLWVRAARDGSGTRVALFAAVAGNLSLLAWFKYANFIVSNVNAMIGEPTGLAIALDPVHLPIGISFFTFQALSYVIDVHRGEADAQRSPLRVGLYISLFPQLVAGPIVRYHHIARELADRHMRLADVAYGVRRFVIGLGKKVLVANVMARAADSIWAMPPDQLTTGLAWLGATSYTLQIYFDFSGYSDMAIGLGRIFGFHFPENFRYPYTSLSLTEFWRRWHISLSSWFRDYLYVPLGGNRRGPGRTYCNLMIVFLLCGLWHGASWTFAIWGLYHGAFLILERLGRERAVRPVWKGVRRLYLLAVVGVGWVIFRSDSLTQTLIFLQALVGFAPGDGLHYYVAMHTDAVFLIALGAGLVGSVPIVPALVRAWESRVRGPGRGAWAVAGQTVAFLAIALVLLASAMQLSDTTHNPFIYFRF